MTIKSITFHNVSITIDVDEEVLKPFDIAPQQAAYDILCELMGRAGAEYITDTYTIDNEVEGKSTAELFGDAFDYATAENDNNAH